MTTDKHIFETIDDQSFEFDTEEEMHDFAIKWTMGNLVKNGYGELVIDDQGEEAFRINEKGVAHFQSLTQPVSH